MHGHGVRGLIQQQRSCDEPVDVTCPVEDAAVSPNHGAVARRHAQVGERGQAADQQGDVVRHTATIALVIGEVRAHEERNEQKREAHPLPKIENQPIDW